MAEGTGSTLTHKFGTAVKFGLIAGAIAGTAFVGVSAVGYMAANATAAAAPAGLTGYASMGWDFIQAGFTSGGAATTTTQLAADPVAGNTVAQIASTQTSAPASVSSTTFFSSPQPAAIPTPTPPTAPAGILGDYIPNP